MVSVSALCFERPVEKSFCVLEYEKMRSATVVQRQFRTHFRKDPPNRVSIYEWYSKFSTTGCLNEGKSAVRPSVTVNQVDFVRESIALNPKKSTCKVKMELQTSHSTVYNIMRKRLKMFPYKLQLLQSLTDGDQLKRFHFCGNLLDLQEEDLQQI